MGILDLNINSLTLNIANAEGYEHRVRPIAARAAAIFAERLDAHFESGRISGPKSIGKVSALSIGIDLRTVTDESAAQSIALSWLEAVRLKLI